MALIIYRPHFKLETTVAKAGGQLFNLELKQLHPNAQRPHWRRITQLNPTREELVALRDLIQEALDDK